MKSLYVFTQPGCAACYAAKKAIEAWPRAREDVCTVVVNIEVFPAKFGYEPHKTPAYLLMDGTTPLVTHEGALSVKQLDAFLKEAER